MIHVRCSIRIIVYIVKGSFRSRYACHVLVFKKLKLIGCTGRVAGHINGVIEMTTNNCAGVLKE